jgi:cobalt-zinc-cadmium efflux system protein
LGSHDHHGHHHHDHGDHSHDHGHGHAHVHAPASFGRAFAIGIVLNTALVVAEAVYGYIGNSTALLFASGRKDDINIEGAYLHMAADAAVSLGVVISAALIIWTGWLWLDPVTSLVICVTILWSTTSLLRSSIDMSMAAAPRGTDIAAIKMFLLERPGVSGIHDLHVWPISTTETALTCHLVMPTGAGDAFLMETAELLKASFRIGHTTLQIETHPDNGCALAPDDVV